MVSLLLYLVLACFAKLPLAGSTAVAGPNDMELSSDESSVADNIKAMIMSLGSSTASETVGDPLSLEECLGERYLDYPYVEVINEATQFKFQGIVLEEDPDIVELTNGTRYRIRRDKVEYFKLHHMIKKNVPEGILGPALVLDTNPECWIPLELDSKTYQLLQLGDAHKSTVLRLRVKDVAIKLIELLQALHSLGLNLNIGAVRANAGVEQIRYDHTFLFDLVVEDSMQAWTHDLRNRKNDFHSVGDTLSAFGHDKDVLLKQWSDCLWNFRQYIEHELILTDPEYRNWKSKFNRLKFLSISDYIEDYFLGGYGDACSWLRQESEAIDYWLEKSIEVDGKPEYHGGIWKYLHGEELINLLSDPRSNNPCAQNNDVNLVATVFKVVDLSLSYKRGTLAEQFDWLTSIKPRVDLCGRIRYDKDLKAGTALIDFQRSLSWMLCPERLVRIYMESSIEFEENSSKIVIELAAQRDIETVKKALQLETSSGRIASGVLHFRGIPATDARSFAETEMQWLIDSCANKSAILELISLNAKYLNLGHLCLIADDVFANAIRNREPDWSRIWDAKIKDLASVFLQDGYPYLMSFPNTFSAVAGAIGGSLVELKNRSPSDSNIAFLELISGMVSTPSGERLFRSQLDIFKHHGVASVVLWLMRHPSDSVDAFIARPGITRRAAAAGLVSYLMNAKGISKEELLVEIFSQESNLLNNVFLTNQSAQSFFDYIGLMIDSLDLKRVTVQSMASQYPQVAEFCESNWFSTVAQSSTEIRRILLWICPGLFESMADANHRQTALSLLSSDIPVRSDTIEVTRNTAFSDALPLLTSSYANRKYPRRTKFIGEVGVDQGGLTADLISEIAYIASTPVKEDPAGGLFILKKADSSGPEQFHIDPITDSEITQYLVFNPSITDESRNSHFYAFGRLMAISIIKKSQLGIPLPTMFFAQFLNGEIRLNDLLPEEGDRIRTLENMIKHVEKSQVGFTLPVYELGPEEQTVTPTTARGILEAIVPYYMQDERFMGAIREGFESFFPLAKVRAVYTPRTLKELIVGEKLKIEELRKKTRFHSDWASGVEAPRQQVVDWFFQWLANQPQAIQRKCMKFFTGSSSLSTRNIEISGPECSKQRRNYNATGRDRPHMLPLGHTCFRRISLPHYSSIEELAERVSTAIVNDGFGMG